jgi:hypothetical protein
VVLEPCCEGLLPASNEIDNPSRRYAVAKELAPLFVKLSPSRRVSGHEECVEYPLSPTAARRKARRLFTALTLTFVVDACSPTQMQSPISEYVAGIKDAIDTAQPDRLPTLVVTWDPGEAELGQCKRIAGEPVVYLHVGRILDSSDTVEQTRALIAEVLVHELAHARLTCTDADHAILPPPVRRLPRTSPSLLKQYSWDQFGLAGRNQSRAQ